MTLLLLWRGASSLAAVYSPLLSILLSFHDCLVLGCLHLNKLAGFLRKFPVLSKKVLVGGAEVQKCNDFCISKLQMNLSKYPASLLDKEFVDGSTSAENSLNIGGVFEIALLTVGTMASSRCNSIQYANVLVSFVLPLGLRRFDYTVQTVEINFEIEHFVFKNEGLHCFESLFVFLVEGLNSLVGR